MVLRLVLIYTPKETHSRIFVQDADNATVHWGLEPIRRPKAGTGARSARPKAGIGLHWGHGVPAVGRHWPALGHGVPAEGLHWGTECPAEGRQHWPALGHVGVPGCWPKAGAGWAEGPALRRAQCARGAVSSALCTARGSAVCAPYMYHYKTNSRITSRIIRLELVVDYQPDYHLNYQPDYQPGSTEVPVW